MSRSRPRIRAVNTVTGLVTLPLVVTSALTGAAVWAAVSGVTGTLGLVAVIAVHSYTGLVALPLVLVKIVAGLASLRRRSRPRPGDLSSVLLVVGVLVVYASGTLLHLNLHSLPNALLKSTHLWAAAATAPLVTYHLVRHLRLARAGATRSLREAPADARGWARRRVLLLGGAGLVGWALTRLVARSGSAAAATGPNDFPVTITAGGSARPDPSTWAVLVGGDVRRPQTFSLSDLRALGLERHRYSLDCILGWSVSREWGGVPVAELVGRCAPTGQPISAVFQSTTGYESALPAERLRDRRTMLALEVDGVPLASEHGAPARVMAPGVIGERCVKWVERVTVVCA